MTLTVNNFWFCSLNWICVGRNCERVLLTFLCSRFSNSKFSEATDLNSFVKVSIDNIIFSKCVSFIKSLVVCSINHFWAILTKNIAKRLLLLFQLKFFSETMFFVLQKLTWKVNFLQSEWLHPGRNNGQNFSGMRALTAVKIIHRSRY